MGSSDYSNFLTWDWEVSSWSKWGLAWSPIDRDERGTGIDTINGGLTSTQEDETQWLLCYRPGDWLVRKSENWWALLSLNSKNLALRMRRMTFHIIRLSFRVDFVLLDPSFSGLSIVLESKSLSSVGVEDLSFKSESQYQRFIQTTIQRRRSKKTPALTSSSLF